MVKWCMGIGFVWLAFTAMWVVLTGARLWAGEEYFHQLIMATLSSGLATQAFNQAAVMSRLGGLR